MKSITKQKGQILIILLATMFGGGTALSTYITGSSAKQVKKTFKEVIEDETRRNEIAAIVDDWNKINKKTIKGIRKEQKSLLKVVSNYGATKETALSALAQLNKSIDSQDKEFLDLRLTIKKKMTEDEWQKFWAMNYK